MGIFILYDPTNPLRMTLLALVYMVVHNGHDYQQVIRQSCIQPWGQRAESLILSATSALNVPFVQIVDECFCKYILFAILKGDTCHQTDWLCTLRYDTFFIVCEKLTVLMWLLDIWTIYLSPSGILIISKQLIQECSVTCPNLPHHSIQYNAMQ